MMGGLGRLYPIMIGGDSRSRDRAAEQHQRLFGFRPVLPSAGPLDLAGFPSVQYGLRIGLVDSGNRVSTQLGRSDYCTAFSRCN